LTWQLALPFFVTSVGFGEGRQLGLQVTDEDQKRVYLRALEERGHHCLVLEKGEAGVANELGFKLFDEADLEKAYRWFSAARPSAFEVRWSWKLSGKQSSSRGGKIGRETSGCENLTIRPR
jgi:hypothetical protein